MSLEKNEKKCETMVYAYIIVCIFIAEQFSSVAGTIIVGFILFLFVYKNKSYICKKTIIFIYLCLIYFICTPSCFTNTHYISNVIVMIFIILTGELLLDINKDYVPGIMTDFVYYLLLADIIFEILKYAIKYPSVIGFSGDYITEPIFWGHYHYADFAVIVICVFMLGVKLQHKVTASILVLFSLYILPARILKFFVLLYVLFSCAKSIILKLVTKKNIIRWFLLINILIIVFAYVWVVVLSNVFAVGEGHSSMYNQSEYERFTSVLYSVDVIIKNGLLINGIDTTIPYELLCSDSVFRINIGPHNSIFNMFILYSPILSLYFWISMIKGIDQTEFEKNVIFILSYLVCSLILHDMFIGLRGFLFWIVLYIPYKKERSIG